MPGVELQAPFLACAALAVLLAAWGPATRRTAALDGLLALGVVLLAAWPMLDDPFETDTIPLRVAFARFAPLADWNHPPLGYLLNLPARWSLRPEVVRLAPLTWLVVESLLLQVLARRWGGRVPGALAVVWFAAEVRRRMGIQDIGDWDLAGCFLLGAVLWLGARRDDPPRGAGHAFEIAGLVGLGIASSWLMWPVGVAVAGTLAVHAARDRGGWLPPAAVAAVVALAAWPLGRVVALGHDIAQDLDPNVHEAGLWTEVLVQGPIGRTAVMALPLGLGVVWLVTQRRRLEVGGVLAACVAVLGALGVASRVSHVNGGYYAGLLTPVLLASGAAGVGGLGAWGRAWLPARAPRREGALAGALLTVAVTAWPLPPVPPYAVEATLPPLLPSLAARSHADGRPIVSNLAGLGPQLAYARAQAGLGDLRDVIAPPQVSVVARQLLFQPCLVCEADPACLARARDAWVVWERRQRTAEERACTDRLVEGCEVLHGERVVDDVYVVDCRRAASAGPPSAPGLGDHHLGAGAQVEEHDVDAGVAGPGAGEPAPVR